MIRTENRISFWKWTKNHKRKGNILKLFFVNDETVRKGRLCFAFPFCVALFE